MPVQPDNKDEAKEPAIKFPSIERILGFIHDRDARLGLAISVFVLFMLIFIGFSREYGGLLEGGFFEFIRTFCAFLLLATGFVVFFRVIDGSIWPRVIVWYFTSLFLLTVSIFWLQAILRTPAPFLIDARCFIQLWSPGCPLGTTAAPVKNIEVITPGSPNMNIGADMATEYRPDKPHKVVVKFAGAVSREEIIKASTALAAKGWTVKNAGRGGERTAQAAGLDQVRYFYQADAELAKALARQYNQLATWPGFEKLSIAYIPGQESVQAEGNLIVWTSVD